MNTKSFTLLELIMIIVIVGILVATAVPTCIDLQAQAKEAECKGVLGGLRSGISIWCATEAVTAVSDSLPALNDLTTNNFK